MKLIQITLQDLIDNILEAQREDMEIVRKTEDKDRPLADILREEIKPKRIYEDFLAQHQENLIRLTRKEIKEHGFVSVCCDGNIQRTSFNDFMPSCMLADKEFLLKWIKDNRFKWNNGYHNLGYKAIEWKL